MSKVEYDHTIYTELVRFMEECRKAGDPLYIYGEAERQKMLGKFLDLCKIPFAGYVTTASIDSSPLDENCTVILGLADKYYYEVIPILHKKNITKMITISENTKNQIYDKLHPKEENMTIEINLTNHCNLNCQMCDHYSQLAEPYFISLEEFERDIKRLAELTGDKLLLLSQMGGEPLLHPQVTEILRVARNSLPTNLIQIHTNGILLLQEKYEMFWEACREQKIEILITAYPIGLDFEAILKKAKDYGVSLKIFNSYDLEMGDRKKISYKYPMDITKSQESWQAITCMQFNRCTVLLHGRIYQCPTCAHIDIFNKYFGTSFERVPEDSIDIHQIESYEEISKFLSNPVPFCKYCDVRRRELLPWAQSKRTIDEYIADESSSR